MASARPPWPAPSAPRLGARSSAWTATAGAVVLQAVATIFALDLPGLDEEPHHHVGHLAGHVLAFDLAAVAVTAFVGRLSSQLREREAALRTSEAERARGEKLAALGTLAAGTAHALGTPLGAIELLAEEVAAAGPGEAADAHAELVAQLRRCRAILDRMLAGDEGTSGRTDAIGERVAAWVDAWRTAQGGEVQLAVTIEPLTEAVRGAEDGWRDATWTVLDNARTAGDPIRVAVRRVEDRVEIREKIFFELDSATIKSVSFSLLDDIVATLDSHPDIVKLVQDISVPVTKDSWFVIVAVGDGDLSPVFTPVEMAPVQLQDVVTEAPSDVPAIGPLLSPAIPIPRSGAVIPYAITNPIYVDVDGAGWTAPGLPTWLLPPEEPEEEPGR